MKRQTFAASSDFIKHQIRCSRCRNRFRVGDRVTVRSERDLVTYTHAGRSCPPTYNPKPTI